jgi:hypothetical protein
MPEASEGGSRRGVLEIVVFDDADYSYAQTLAAHY